MCNASVAKNDPRRKVYTTHPGEDAVKKIVPKAHNVPETPEQRHTRLLRQKAANRIRVKALTGHTWEVPSQRRDGAGQVVCRYIVREYEGLGWTCTCKWSAGDGAAFLGHGIYVPGENDIAECAHMAAVLAHIARQDKEVERLTRVLIARLEAQEQEASAA